MKVVKGISLCSVFVIVIFVSSNTQIKSSGFLLGTKWKLDQEKTLQLYLIEDSLIGIRSEIVSMFDEMNQFGSDIMIVNFVEKDSCQFKLFVNTHVFFYSVEFQEIYIKMQNRSIDGVIKGELISDNEMCLFFEEKYLLVFKRIDVN